MMRLAVPHLDLAASRAAHRHAVDQPFGPGIEEGLHHGAPDQAPRPDLEQGVRALVRPVDPPVAVDVQDADREHRLDAPSRACAMAAAVRVASVAASAARRSPLARRSDSSSSVRRRTSIIAATSATASPMIAMRSAPSTPRASHTRGGERRRERASAVSAAAATAAAAGIGDGEWPRCLEVDERPRVGRLRRRDDRADHAVGDGVRRRDRDVGQPDRLEAVPELRDRERTGDAAGVRAALRACSALRASSATMSVIPMRPPGRSTRAISREHGAACRPRG